MIAPIVSLMLSAAVCPSNDLAACQAACAQKQPESCHNLGALQLKTDPALARASFKKACDLGIGMSCSWTGRLLEQGKGGTAAPSEAVAFYERGCKLKHSGGCLQLGKILHDGMGAPKNLEKAAGWYSKGCDLGDSAACMNLALMEVTGDGIAKSPARGEKRLATACTGGLAQACTELGVSEFTGELGRPASPTAAGKWWKRACELDDAKGCALLKKVAAR